MKSRGRGLLLCAAIGCAHAPAQPTQKVVFAEPEVVVAEDPVTAEFRLAKEEHERGELSEAARRLHDLAAGPGLPTLQRASALLYEEMVSAMLGFAGRRFPSWNAVAEFEGQLGGNADDMQLFAPWVAYHCRVDRRPLVDWYREQQGRNLSEEELARLATQQRAWLSHLGGDRRRAGCERFRARSALGRGTAGP